MSIAIGIDLGTTNTVAAAVIDGVAVTLEDEHGRRLLPSVVSFHPSGTVLVGEPARERRLIDPENTIFSVKPLLGRSWSSDEVAAAKARFPFKLAEGTKNSTMVVARDVAYALPEISAFVLRRVKAIAEAALGQPVDRAVITVPANFNDLQRASTKIAGKLAGLEVMRILNEPTSAALAYGQSISTTEKIAVYDLGGGTFDVTLLDLTGNVFEVLATAGDTALGGDDVDALLSERMAIEVLQQFRVDPRTSPGSLARLAFVAEEIKKELSTSDRVERELTGVGYGEGGRPITMPFSMTRDELEAIARPLVERTMAVARQSIEIIGLSPRDFHRVVLVGGSTRMPLVVRMVEELFGQPPHRRVNPDEVVALGAAIQAHALNRHKRAHEHPSGERPTRAASPPAGEQAPARPPGAIPAPSPAGVPASPSPLPEFFSFNKAPAVISFSDVPPSPSAAKPPSAPRLPPSGPKLPPPSSGQRAAARALSMEGRPIEPPRPPPVPKRAQAAPPAASASLPAPDAVRFEQGSAIATAASAPLLIDVTPLSLGVETVGGYADVLIPANTPVPCEKTRTFLTASDGQTSVSIRVAQGSSSRFADNTRLGDLELSLLRSALRGEVKIAVTFELDADGILNVRARDHDTGREATATMRLLGANTEPEDVVEMAARQARHAVV